MRARCDSKKFGGIELAIAATSAATTIATASSASAATPSAAMTAASATTASAAVAATSPTRAAAFTLRTSFVHDQRAAQKILAVERFDRFICFGVVPNFGETEAARLTRETIAQQRERIRLDTNLRKQCCYLLFRGLEREIAYIQFLHGRSPFASGACPGAKHEAEETGTRPQAANALWPHPAEASAPAAQEHLAAIGCGSQQQRVGSGLLG
jgi:hypothetical protein